MGRTISGYKSDKRQGNIGLTNGRKASTKKKNKNISKWGKGQAAQGEIQVDTFELQSPRTQMHPIEVLWE